MQEKYTFDAHFYKRERKIILAKSDSESREHIVLKLLSYMIFYDPNMLVEYSVDMHYKPDLVVLDEDGRPTLWIDCGHVGLDKVDALSRKLRRTRIILVKKSKSELKSFKMLLQKKLDHYDRLEFLAFEKSFVQEVAGAIQKTNKLALYEAAENVIGLAMHDQIFESELYR